MTTQPDPISDATTESFRGTDQIRQRLGRSRKGVAFKAGEALEEIVARKANEHAALHSSDARVHVTHDEGRPTDPADLIIRTASGAERPVQVKTSNNPVWMVEALSHPKYDGLDKIVPNDKVATVREEAARRAERADRRGDEAAARRYRDTAERVSGAVDIDGKRVGATSRREARTAARRPGLYAAGVDAATIGRETRRRAVGAAMDSALDNLFQSATDCTIRYLSGDIDAATAAEAATRATVRATADAAARAGLAGTVRAVAERAGSVPLSDLPLAAELTNLAIDTALLARRYATGEIERADLEEGLGDLAIGAASRWVFAVGATAAFGPGAPAAIGCLIGHRVAVAALHTLSQAQRELDNTVRDAARADEISREAIAALAAAERRLQDAAHRLNATTALALGDAFDAVNEGMRADDHNRLVTGLAALTALCRHELVYVDFEAFNLFMTASEERLIL